VKGLAGMGLWSRSASLGVGLSDEVHEQAVQRAAGVPADAGDGMRFQVDQEAG